MQTLTESYRPGFPSLVARILRSGHVGWRILEGSARNLRATKLGKMPWPLGYLSGTTGLCFVHVLYHLKILWEAQMDIFFDYRSLTIGGPIKSIGKGNTTWPFGIRKRNRKIPLKSGTSHGFETSILILLILWTHITSPKCYGKNAFFKQKEESYGIIYCETPLKYIQLSSL